MSDIELNKTLGNICSLYNTSELYNGRPECQFTLDPSSARAATSSSETDGVREWGAVEVNQPAIWDLMVERIVGSNQSGEKLTEACAAGAIDRKRVSS